MSRVRLRDAAEEDIARLMCIAGESRGAAVWTRAEYEKYVAVQGHRDLKRCLLLTEGAHDVEGFVAGAYLAGDSVAVLENLAVAADARRKGVAKALCAGMAEWARAAGAGGLSLEVRASNQAARGLYAAIGFVEDGRRRKYYSDPDEDAVLMCLRLF